MIEILPIKLLRTNFFCRDAICNSPEWHYFNGCFHFILSTDTPGKPNLTANFDGEVLFKGSKVSLTCSLGEDIGNPSADSYVWLHRGVPLDGVTQSVYQIDSLSVASQGNYSCSASNSVGKSLFAHFFLKAKGK